MAEFPYLPLWTDAHLADTRHLTTLQQGAYLLLLMTAWRTPENALLNDDAYLAKCSGLGRKAWMANKKTILAFWHVGVDKLLHQKKLDKVRQRSEQMTDQRRMAGQISALKRKGSASTLVQRKHNEDPTSYTHNHIHTQLLANGPTQNGDILPLAWEKYASDLGIPIEQIEKSWEKFKSISTKPYEFYRWQGWINKEKVNQ